MTHELLGRDPREPKDRAPSCAANALTQPLRGHPGGQPRRFKLTDYQLRVVELIALGKSNKEIARDLGLSSDTIRCHVKKALRYTQTANRTALAVAYVLGEIGH